MIFNKINIYIPDILNAGWMNKLVSLVVFTAFFIACRQDEKIPFCELHPDECVDIREVKEYFCFNIGSYWVYKEENSGMIDSIYVLQTYSDSNSYYFDTRLHSTYDTYDYRYWTGGGATTDELIVEKSKRTTIVYKAKTKPGDFVSESYCFPFYPKTGSWLYSYGLQYNFDNILKVDTIYANLVVFGLPYNDVICISEEHTASEEAQPTKHYYTKGIGLLKKELIDSNQTWNLINYHIEN